MTLKEAKSFLKVEDNSDDERIKKDIASAEAEVDQYLYPRSMNATKDELKLSDAEKEIARKGVEYALHNFYYNRGQVDYQELARNLIYILQPIRTLKV